VKAPKKHTETKHPAFNDTIAYRKHESRVIADHHYSTPQCNQWTCSLPLEAAPKDVWIFVDSNGVNDSWVDVSGIVLQDIGRGASDVSAGTTPPRRMRIVLEVMKGCFDVYISSVAFALRRHW
jgi:hypothetical protein